MPYSFSRREFLQRGTLVAALATFPSLGALALDQEPLERKAAAKKVIVVGAGLAGLSAAYELTQAGHDVAILEAQTRAGGRVLTLREPFSDGLYANAGAARIWDDHNYTLRYAKSFGLTVEDFYPKDLQDVWYFRGTRVLVKHGEPVDMSPFKYPLSEEERKLGYGGLWDRYVPGSLVDDIYHSYHSNPTGPDWPPPSLRHYDQMSFTDFLQSQGASAGAVELIAADFGFPEASALWVLQEVAMTGGTKMLEIGGGMDLLPRAFAGRLANRISYGVPVVRIEQDATGVQVVYHRAGAPQTMRGDYLICAIPFSTLRVVEVSPPFAPEKRRAIEEATAEHLGKVFLQMRKRFWLEQGCNGFGKSDVLGDIWQPTLNQPGPRGILESYVSGNRARVFAAMTEGERIATTLDEMERVFPGARENCEGGASTFWDNDPWARGAIAAFYPGQLSQFGPYLARAEGRIHFAGERTSAWNGWMQGALESGNRAAREVNDAA